MKISKTQLKQIIKEELAVILTNEEAGELFGEAVEAELEEKKGIKNPGKYIDGERAKAGVDKDGDGVPDGDDSDPKDGAKNESMIQEDMATIMQNLDLIVSSIIQVGATFGIPMLAAALGKLGLEAAQAARTAGKAKTMIGDKDSDRLVDFLYNEITDYKDFKSADK